MSSSSFRKHLGKKVLRRALRIALGVSIALALLTACGQKSAGAGGKVKDTFVIARQRAPMVGFDPAYVGDNIDLWNITNLYDQLVRVKADGSGLEPALAESWDVSPDGTSYTFHLRKGVTFWDGAPLKAVDVQYSLDRARAKDTAWGYIFSDVTSVEAKDDNTVVVHIKGPNSSFISVLAMFNASVVEKAYVEKVGKDVLAKKPMGTGAYMLKEWVEGQYALLEANPKYWEPGLPKTKYVKWMSVPDDNTRILQVQSGQVDAAEYVPLNRVSELQSDARLQVKLFPSTFVYYFVPNHNKKIFKDINVRKAIYAALDRDALVKTALFSLGTPANSYMSPATPTYSKTAATEKFDLEAAKAYLKKSAYPNGFDMKLLVVSGDQMDSDLSTALKEMLSKVGINVTIEALEYGARQDKLAKRDYDAHLTYWTDDVLDPDEVTTYEIDFPVAGSMNSDYNDPEAVKLAESARSITDPAKRAEAYAQLQQRLNDDAAMLPLFYKPFSMVLSSKVEGFQQLPLGSYIYRNVTVKQ
jgi:peptide/nickel transport system substrate-binding protein